MGESNPRRILVVDDEKDVLKVNRILLEKGGYAVETAQSGEEALKKAAAGTALIVLDITMPGLDAYALCEGLARDKAVARIPLLVVADFEEAAKKLLEKVPAPGDYITKPTKKEAFLEKVKSLIGRADSVSKGPRPSGTRGPGGAAGAGGALAAKNPAEPAKGD